MKILIDCDVLLDVALKRDPFFVESAKVLEWAESHPGRASIAWHTLSIVAYLLDGEIRAFLSDLLGFTQVAPASHEHAEKALRYSMADFEDALQAASAEAFGASVIVTRNEKDYRGSPILAMSPAGFIKTLSV